MSSTALQMPESVELDETTYTDTYGRFIVAPLERGFGVTIGNALRRVLLSSIQGAAITAIKIDGILHEFSTIDGVVEDIAEVILNLKKVRIKLNNKNVDKVILKIKGSGEFKAADIAKDTEDFEILNPESHVMTLNDDADFEMELKIARGRGYSLANDNKLLDQPIGMIPIDSIFTPVTKVKYHIENTRVGVKTDYEKLILEVYTDGSITPEDALTYCGKIIKDHIQLFINFDIEDEEDDVNEIDEEMLRIRKLLKTSVDELELSVRSHNCLKAANIKTISELVSKEESEMLKFRNFGRKSLTEIHKILEEKNLGFGMDIDKYLKDDK
ncbi:MAG: DNA-directed RNA polymerase subunit alpha [Calditrichaeota bacterium]|nr:DNA-directed RNA polymerase subunit alpha [Calditrichota bacterium]